MPQHFTNQTHQTPPGNFQIQVPKMCEFDLFNSYPPAAPKWPLNGIDSLTIIIFFTNPQIRLHIWIAVPAFEVIFFGEPICRVLWLDPTFSLPFRLARSHSSACWGPAVFELELQKQLSSDAHFIRIKEEPRAQTDSQRFDKTRNHLEQITDHHPAWCSKLLSSQGNHKATTWQGTKSLQKKGRLQHVFEANQMLSVPHVTGFGWGWVNLPIPKAFTQATAIPWGHGLMASSRYGLAKGKVVNGLKGIGFCRFGALVGSFWGNRNLSPACQWHVL